MSEEKLQLKKFINNSNKNILVLKDKNNIEKVDILSSLPSFEEEIVGINFNESILDKMLEIENKILFITSIKTVDNINKALLLNPEIIVINLLKIDLKIEKAINNLYKKGYKIILFTDFKK
tara:strand:- start:359 stop:721 length:363 start_codon:yes stop_codon:yes gene_type:complete